MEKGTNIMILKKCFLTRNDCYNYAPKITKVTGIVVHSTGANNSTIKRYVQPLVTDSDYATIIEDIGKNVYDNHWNRSYKAGDRGARESCVHAFIGKNAKGVIETYQILPFDTCAWGCGGGANGSYNYNPTAHIQFEICEDALTDRNYFENAFKEAAEFCAYLCKQFNLTVNDIVSHKESHDLGYGNNHGDPDHWLKKYGKTMNDFRNDVKNILNPPAPIINTPIVDKVTSLKVGDIVTFTGTTHYTNPNAIFSKRCKPGKAKVTVVDLGKKHPYHLINVSGGGSTVYGFVNAADISGLVPNNDTIITKPTVPTPTPTPTPVPTPVVSTIKVGDKVKCKAGVTKFSNGANMASWVKTSTLYVRAIQSNGTIYLVSTEPTKNVYTGRVNAADVAKI